MIGVSYLTQTIYAGALDKRSKIPMWKHKKDVTSDVLKCIIEKVGDGMMLNVGDADGDEQWEISVTRIKKQ